MATSPALSDDVTAGREETRASFCFCPRFQRRCASGVCVRGMNVVWPMLSSTSCSAMKNVYSGSIEASGNCGHGSTMVSTCMFWRGAPGSATRLESSCIVPSVVTVRSSSGAMLVMASRAAAATMPSHGSHWSCRSPKTPLPRQLTPPNLRSKSSWPAKTAALALSLSALMWASSASHVSCESTCCRLRHPFSSSMPESLSAFQSTFRISHGKACIVLTPYFAPTKVLPSLTAIRSAFAARTSSSSPIARPCRPEGRLPSAMALVIWCGATLGGRRVWPRRACGAAARGANAAAAGSSSSHSAAGHQRGMSS
mmetsp:Transcript_19163/g.46263  ORF Transcript_19163/g.46263 Transcript_19163/m.46263 type:complete len:312 (-) Transcript_19163:8-943(-)